MKELTEAEAMRKRYLLRRGIAKDWIILEDKSVTTRENLSFIARNLPPGYNKIIIVTSDFHIRRALLIAELMGLSAYGLPSENSGQHCL